MDSQLVQDDSPVENGGGPLFDDIMSSQEEQFTGSLRVGERGLILDYFAQLAVVAIVKVPGHVTFKLKERLPDGSWLAVLTGKIPHPEIPLTPQGRCRWLTVTLNVRVIRIEIPGFRPFWLMTTLLDPAITPREIALHHHRCWDIESAYDEIKTHLCATLRGKSPITCRSKLPNLIAQEIYALAITYNLVRTLICEAAAEHNQDSTTFSFLDVLQHLVDAAPILTALPSDRHEKKHQYLLDLLADCLIDRSRRSRLNPRVVKVKMSKSARHLSCVRDIPSLMKIVDVALDGAAF